MQELVGEGGVGKMEKRLLVVQERLIVLDDKRSLAWDEN